MRKPPVVVTFMLAVLVSASTWFYVNHVLRAEQIADSAIHNRPRGNLSDLYPRWLGARELLMHGRNPYSAEITQEIQRGYYGRPLNPSRPDDPKDLQGFAYPAYVVFLLAPTVGLSFDSVQIGFRWLLIGLAVLSIPLWLRVLRWRVACATVAILCVLLVGWLPMVQGIKLQQLSLLVAGLLAACGACMAAGWLFLAGGLLALATIKPQLTWPLVAWLLLWSASRWQERRRFVFGFALMMLLLLGGAQVVLPGWLGMFLEGIRQYHKYTQNQSVLVWLFGAVIGRALEIASFLACALCVWQRRAELPSSEAFGRAFSLVLALAVVIVPMFAPYNQVLLVPSILILGRTWGDTDSVLPAVRLAAAVTLFLVLWPWIATVVLTLASFWLTPTLRHQLWPMPFYSNFVVPVLVFAVTVLGEWTRAGQPLRDSATAE